jgi:hypothetical protein
MTDQKINAASVPVAPHQDQQPSRAHSYRPGQQPTSASSFPPNGASPKPRSVPPRRPHRSARPTKFNRRIKVVVRFFLKDYKGYKYSPDEAKMRKAFIDQQIVTPCTHTKRTGEMSGDYVAVINLKTIASNEEIIKQINEQVRGYCTLRQVFPPLICKMVSLRYPLLDFEYDTKQVKSEKGKTLTFPVQYGNMFKVKKAYDMANLNLQVITKLRDQLRLSDAQLDKIFAETSTEVKSSYKPSYNRPSIKSLSESIEKLSTAFAEHMTKVEKDNSEIKERIQKTHEAAYCASHNSEMVHRKVTQLESRPIFNAFPVVNPCVDPFAPAVSIPENGAFDENQFTSFRSHDASTDL